MDNRETLQQLMSEVRQQLTDCRMRTRRLDGLKGVLFMRRDIASQLMEKHMRQLQSRLTNILDQRLAQIEQLCEEKENALCLEKNYVLKRMAVLTEVCSLSTDYLQLGNEELCKTKDCESIVLRLQEILEKNKEDEILQSDEKHINLSYVPLLPDNALSISSVGMLKTSNFDPREVEIERFRDKPREVNLCTSLGLSLFIATSGVKFSVNDIELFQVKVTDGNDTMRPVNVAVCPDQPNKLQVTFSPNFPSAYQLTVKLYDVHVVNSPYKFNVRTDPSKSKSNVPDKDADSGKSSLPPAQANPEADSLNSAVSGNVGKEATEGSSGRDCDQGTPSRQDRAKSQPSNSEIATNSDEEKYWSSIESIESTQNSSSKTAGIEEATSGGNSSSPVKSDNSNNRKCQTTHAHNPGNSEQEVLKHVKRQDSDLDSQANSTTVTPQSGSSGNKGSNRISSDQTSSDHLNGFDSPDNKTGSSGVTVAESGLAESMAVSNAHRNGSEENDFEKIPSNIAKSTPSGSTPNTRSIEQTAGVKGSGCVSDYESRQNRDIRNGGAIPKTRMVDCSENRRSSNSGGNSRNVFLLPRGNSRAESAKCEDSSRTGFSLGHGSAKCGQRASGTDRQDDTTNRLLTLGNSQNGFTISKSNTRISPNSKDKMSTSANSADNMNSRSPNSEGNMNSKLANSEGNTNRRSPNPDGNTNSRSPNPDGNMNIRSPNPESDVRNSSANSEGNMNSRSANSEGNMNNRSANSDGNTNSRSPNPESDVRNSSANSEGTTRNRLPNSEGTMRNRSPDAESNIINKLSPNSEGNVKNKSPGNEGNIRNRPGGYVRGSSSDSNGNNRTGSPHCCGDMNGAQNSGGSTKAGSPDSRDGFRSKSPDCQGNTKHTLERSHAADRHMLTAKRTLVQRARTTQAGIYMSTTSHQVGGCSSIQGPNSRSAPNLKQRQNIRGPGEYPYSDRRCNNAVLNYNFSSGCR